MDVRYDAKVFCFEIRFSSLDMKNLTKNISGAKLLIFGHIEKLNIDIQLPTDEFY